MNDGSETASDPAGDLSGMLSPEAAAMYTRALAAPVPSEEADRNDPAVRELTANGLARVLAATGELYALPPEAALSRALHATTVRWLADAPDFAGALEAINTLAARRASHSTSRNDELVGTSRDRVDALMAAATTSWWTLQPRPDGVSDGELSDPSSWKLGDRPAAHISVRTVYDGQLLRFRAFYECVRDEIDRGADVRFAEWKLPTPLIIADERVAMYFSNRASSGTIIEGVGHVGLLCLAFEGAFTRAVPLRRDTDLADAHHRIHALLALGHNTRAIASMIGVNERTVRRRTNELMDHYGVSSRRALIAYAATHHDRSTSLGT